MCAWYFGAENIETNRHIPEPIELVDLTGWRIHSIYLFIEHLLSGTLSDSVLVPRNISVKEADKTPTVTKLKLLVREKCYSAKLKEK